MDDYRSFLRQQLDTHYRQAGGKIEEADGTPKPALIGALVGKQQATADAIAKMTPEEYGTLLNDGFTVSGLQTILGKQGSQVATNPQSASGVPNEQTPPQPEAGSNSVPTNDGIAPTNGAEGDELANL